MTDQPDDMPEWIKKRNDEKAEDTRKEDEARHAKLAAAHSVQMRGPDFWHRFTDHVLLNVRALDKLEGEELGGSAPLSTSGDEQNCHIQVERRSVKHGADMRKLNLWYAPGDGGIRFWYQDKEQKDIQLAFIGKEIRAHFENATFTAEEMADRLIQQMVDELKPRTGFRSQVW